MKILRELHAHVYIKNTQGQSEVECKTAKIEYSRYWKGLDSA